MSHTPPTLQTGNPELDNVLGGGLTAERLYLVEGRPGTGKTTLGVQFLLEGLSQGEKTLYMSLSETKAELLEMAASHGWDVDGIAIHELTHEAAGLDPESQYTMFEPSEVELSLTTGLLLKAVEAVGPTRMVVDSLSELRMLSQQPLRFRRQILGLKTYLQERGVTTLFLDDLSISTDERNLQTLAHGVIRLERQDSDYGRDRRRLQVLKYRARAFQSGFHDYEIVAGGLLVHPRLPQPAPVWQGPDRPVTSGIATFDELLGGGLKPGSSTLLMGPAGAGKSSTATKFAVSAADRGERSALFIFDETREMLIKRSEGLGMPISRLLDEGLLEIHELEPGEITPGEFAALVRKSIQPREDGTETTTVVIDSLNGYLAAMPEERFLTMQMHELLHHLNKRGVATFLVVAQHGMLGSGMKSSVDTSYLADTVVLFRYFEAAGVMRQAISVVKVRGGDHERTIREFQMRDGEIRVGAPLTNFHGILTGVPTYSGPDADLLEGRPGDGRE